MSVKHVIEYHNKMFEQYKELKETLEALEIQVTEDTAQAQLNNIENIKKMAEQVKANYDRISYIVFLLNQPNKEKKAQRYNKAEQKRLEKISEDNRLSGVMKENKAILDKLGGIK
jgi:hypothetical protein